jgi:Carboxypeptidase regulatory-like domain/AhpC/TSA family
MITCRKWYIEHLKSGLLATTMMLALVSSFEPAGFAARAAADEPADAPLPEIAPAQLAAKLREAMARYDGANTLRVIFTVTQNMSPLPARGKSLREQKPLLVNFRGRARFEGDGTRWRVEYDSMTPASYGETRLYPDRWTAGFDGARHYHLVPNAYLRFGEPALSGRRWSPRSVFWEKGHELVRTLEQPGSGQTSIAITQTVIDGMSCYVVEIKAPNGQGTEAYISPRQGYLTIAQKWTTHGKTHSSRSLLGVHQTVPGIWAPERIDDENYAVRDDGDSRLEKHRRILVVEFQPGRILPESAFRAEIRFGIDLIDRAAGSCFRNDPWWPEIGAMLREQFGWPPQDFSPLAGLYSDSVRDLDGQPAPPLRIATWLNTKPIDLPALKGKVILIEFGDVGNPFEPQFTAALRALYLAYHPLGLEIISIHAPEEDAKEVRNFAQDYRLPYPVAIDDGPPGTSGVTARAFAIHDRICAYLIDHEGNIHPVRKRHAVGDQIIETIVSLLKKSGAGDVKPVSLEQPHLTDKAFEAADHLFQTKVKEALDAGPSGKIAGRIVDENGKSIAGATAHAMLRFLIMDSTSSGAWRNTVYRGPDARFVARSGADGRFELSGLCKGTYDLTVESPGRAWAKRTVFLTPDVKAASVELVLNQRDSIAGEVRDQQGRAVANADVIPTWLQHFEDGEFRYNASLGMDLRMTTDEKGRFRLTSLEQGLYSFEVKAVGFKDLELKDIPSGDENLVITLERSP